jgi:undecaprenyl-diphosphatase
VPILHAIFLGVTQGLSEFLPISSSGHLILVPWLFGWKDFVAGGSCGTATACLDLEKAFDVALHIGTTVALLAYFAKDIGALARAGLGSVAKRSVETTEERLFWLLVLSAVPGALTGALLDSIITEHLGQFWLIGLMLIVFGLVLGFADRLPGHRPEDGFSRRDAVLMGVAQAVALQPGVSRSGATISMARALKFDRASAARLSFLMSVPITIGAITFKLGKLFVLGNGIPTGFGAAFAIGILASAISGYVAVAGLLKLVRTQTFLPFVVYRVLAGTAVIALAASSVR